MSSLLQLNEDALRNALRDAAHEAFGVAVERIDDIAAGLGTRRFFRLYLAPNDRHPTAHMIARVEAEEDPAKRVAGSAPEPALEPVRAFLETAGIPVPGHFGTDTRRGIEWLEDVGDESLERAAHSATPDARRALYREACTLIPQLQHLAAPDPPIEAFSRHLDGALFESKAERVIDWALPYWLGRAPNTRECKVVRDLFAAVARCCAAAPKRLSHRDFKAANIHVLPSDQAQSRLVLIDLQGAFLAPPEYDLVCLLRDSHVPLPWDEVTQHLDATRPLLPDAPDREIFEQRFTLLTLTRVAKDAAHYIHAHSAHGDGRYLPLLPAARAALSHAALRAQRWAPEVERFGAIVQELREP